MVTNSVISDKKREMTIIKKNETVTCSSAHLTDVLSSPKADIIQIANSPEIPSSRSVVTKGLLRTDTALES